MPDGWAWARLGNIGEWKSGATPNRKCLEYYNGDIPWVKTGDLNDDYIKEIPETITKKALKETSVSLIPKDTVLIAMYGATIGKLGITTCEVTTNQACCACCNLKEVNKKFLFYFLMQYKSNFISMAFGGAQPNISKEKIVQVIIPIPPIEEQNKITAKLTELFVFVETIESDKSTLQSTIQQTKSKILDLAIRGKLVPQDPNDEPASVLLERIRAEKEELIKQGKIKRDKKESVIFKGDDNSYYEKIGNKLENIDNIIPFEIPDTWQWCRGYSCFTGMESEKPSGEFFDYIDIDAIDNHLHRIKKTKRMLVSNAPSRASRAVKTGSVLFSLVRPYLENIALVDEKYANSIVSTGFYVCNSSGALYPEYMFCLMISGYVVNGLNQFMKGDNSPSISKDNIENWLYPIPPLNEQKMICHKMKRLFSEIEATEKSLS